MFTDLGARSHVLGTALALVVLADTRPAAAQAGIAESQPAAQSPTTPVAQPQQTPPNEPATPTPLPATQVVQPSPDPTAQGATQAAATGTPATSVDPQTAGAPTSAVSSAVDTGANSPATSGTGDVLRPSDSPAQASEPTQRARIKKSSAFVSDEDRFDERRKRFYSRLYRPAENPARFNLGARIGLIMQGGDHPQAGGRLLQLEVSAGHRWNYFGYSLGVQAAIGRTRILPETVTYPTLVNGVQVQKTEEIVRESNLLLGAGPRFNLGRAGFMGIGYIDPEIAYNFYWARASGNGEHSGTKDMSLPHGPEFRLDSGFIAPPSDSKRWWHGFGTSIGYQIWVGSFKNEIPLIQTVIIGARYQLL